MDIKEKQRLLLQLLKEFDSIAKRIGLYYVAASGTCLGAIREKGFIPWDGDLDVLLPLPQYLLCEQYMMNNDCGNIKWVSYKTDKDAPNLMARIYDKSATFENLEEYPYIDLFALVGMPNDPKEQERMSKRSLQNYRVYWIKKRKYIYSLNRKKSMIGFLLQILLLLYPSKLCIKEFEKEMVSYPYDAAEYVAPLTGLYGKKESVPKKWFQGEPYYTEFCDYSIPVLPNYDEYLIHQYGKDYLTPKQFTRYK